MTVIIQISDPHFGTEQPVVVRALVQMVQRIQPTLVVLSGDITQRARRAQFEAAQVFVEELQVPNVLALPGNHDLPLFNILARTLFPYGQYERVFGTDLEPEFENRDVLVICVNTTRPARRKDGEVSPDQVSQVSRRLSGVATEKLRIVVTHQPVHVIRESDVENLLHGREAAVQAWSQAGCDLVMGGHIHLPYVRPLSERYTNLPRSMWVVQAGTAVSRRVRHEAPNSVNVVRYDCDAGLSCIVERWDYAGGARSFECVNTDTLSLAR
jgi:3',5'-cyclic AMP phosphodiesterase CpdA